MNKLHFNEKNKPYYSEGFIKGFECGVERQFNADQQEFNDALEKAKKEPHTVHGEWLYFDGAMENYEPTYFYKCSVCRHRSDWYYKFEKTSTPNYCPNCGVKMEGKK